MSKSLEKDYIFEIYKENKNNSKLFDDEIILYNENNKYIHFYKVMKKGYIEMGDINLQIAVENEIEMIDVNNYEAWLCGE